VLPLVYLINNGLYFPGAILFLFSVSTDFLDGYLARKLDASSRFGAYFDATADFIFVLSLFAAFIPKGFCADWVLFVMATEFVGFVSTSLYFTKIYDPVGKHFGSLLFAVLFLRFILSGQLFYDAVTVSVTAFAAASILSRAAFITAKRRNPQGREETKLAINCQAPPTHSASETNKHGGRRSHA
jgi:phosphatidylglycerophosphate synthase